MLQFAVVAVPARGGEMVVDTFDTLVEAEAAVRVANKIDPDWDYRVSEFSVFSSAVASATNSRLGPVKFEVYQVCGINDDGDTCWSQTYANRKDAEELYNKTIKHEDVIICIQSVY